MNTLCDAKYFVNSPQVRGKFNDLFLDICGILLTHTHTHTHTTPKSRPPSSIKRAKESNFFDIFKQLYIAASYFWYDTAFLFINELKRGTKH
jgi:hypothetical protein